MGRHKGSFNKKPTFTGGDTLPAQPPVSVSIGDTGNKYRAINTIMLVGKNYYPGDVFEMSANDVAPLLKCGACVKVKNDGR